MLNNNGGNNTHGLKTSHVNRPYRECNREGVAEKVAIKFKKTTPLL